MDPEPEGQDPNQGAHSTEWVDDDESSNPLETRLERVEGLLRALLDTRAAPVPLDTVQGSEPGAQSKGVRQDTAENVSDTPPPPQVRADSEELANDSGGDLARMGDDPPGDDPGNSSSSGESSSSSGDESSDPDSGKGSRRRKAKAKAERRKSGLHQAIEAVGRDVSEVAAMWSKDPLLGNALSIPMVNANLIPKHDPDSEYMLRLAKRPAGSHLPVLTARRIIDWMMKHSVS